MTGKQAAEIKLEWIRQHCLDTIDTAKRYEKWAIQKNKTAERLFAAAAIDQLEYILKTFFNDEQEPTTTLSGR